MATAQRTELHGKASAAGTDSFSRDAYRNDRVRPRMTELPDLGYWSPSPEEIRNTAAEIRNNWTVNERRKRLVDSTNLQLLPLRVMGYPVRAWDEDRD